MDSGCNNRSHRASRECSPKGSNKEEVRRKKYGSIFSLLFPCSFFLLPCEYLVERDTSDWVTPFGYPRVKGWLPPHRGFSQAPTSFIVTTCRGIHHMLLSDFTITTKNVTRAPRRCGTLLLYDYVRCCFSFEVLLVLSTCASSSSLPMRERFRRFTIERIKTRLQRCKNAPCLILMNSEGRFLAPHVRSG